MRGLWTAGVLRCPVLVPGATSCYVAVDVCPQHWLLATAEVAHYSLLAPIAADQAPARRCGPPWWPSRGMGVTWPSGYCLALSGRASVAQVRGRVEDGQDRAPALRWVRMPTPRRSRCLRHRSGRHSSGTACLRLSGCSRASQAVLTGVVKRCSCRSDTPARPDVF